MGWSWVAFKKRRCLNTFFRSVFSLNRLNDFIKLCIKISINKRTSLFVYDCVQEKCMSFQDNRFLDLIAFPTNIKGHKTSNPVSPAENSRLSSLTFYSTTLTCCFAHQLFARKFTPDVFACPTVCFFSVWFSVYKGWHVGSIDRHWNFLLRRPFMWREFLTGGFR